MTRRAGNPKRGETARHPRGEQPEGGVGETTVALNTAGALNQRGRDALLVDLDPQGTATEGLGFGGAYDEKPPSMFEVQKEMDVVPSNVDHHHTKREMTHVRRPTEQLSLALEGVRQEYHYLLIDCPPSLCHLTGNALHVAQNVLIPALAESTSKRVVELLFEFDPDCDMCAAFLEVAPTLDQQFGLPPPETPAAGRPADAGKYRADRLGTRRKDRLADQGEPAELEQPARQEEPEEQEQESIRVPTSTCLRTSAGV